MPIRTRYAVINSGLTPRRMSLLRSANCAITLTTFTGADDDGDNGGWRQEERGSADKEEPEKNIYIGTRALLLVVIYQIRALTVQTQYLGTNKWMCSKYVLTIYLIPHNKQILNQRVS